MACTSTPAASKGLTVGLEGIVERNGAVVGRISLRAVTGSSSLAVVTESVASPGPDVGDDVRFTVQREETEEGEGAADPDPTPDPAERESAEPEDARAGAQEPLLTPRRDRTKSSRRNLFHGGLRLGTTFLQDRERDLDYRSQRLSTWGAGERLGGGPWSLEWSAEAYRRDGDGYDVLPSRDATRLRADRLVLRRHFASGDMLGVGRFVPSALPDLGRVDGVYGEMEPEDGIRLGALAGFRPDRDDLGFDREHPMLAVYGAHDRDVGESAHWWVAGGAMATWFEGAPDQHALLLSSRLVRGRAWVSLSSQVDLYSGGEDRRSGTELTRLHFSGSTPLTDRIALFGGWHQYQLADTDSLREVFPSNGFFDRGNRRGSIGLREDLPANVTLEQEVAHVSGGGTEGDLQWTLRARKSGLPLASSLDGSVYRITGLEADGYGASLGWYAIPHPDWQVHLLLDTSRVEYDLGSTFSATTLSGFVDWGLRDDLSLSARIGSSFGEDLRTTFADLSATWRF